MDWRNSPPAQVFTAQTSKKPQQHYPFPPPFWIPRTNTSPFSFSKDEFRPHMCDWAGLNTQLLLRLMAGISSLTLPDDVSMNYCHLQGCNALLCAERCSVLSRDPSSSSSCCYWGKFGIFSVFQQVSSHEGCHITPTVLNSTAAPISQLPFCIAKSWISHPWSEQKGTYCHNRWFSRVMFTQAAAEIISRLNTSFQKWGTMQSFSNEVH